ncbi:MAG TPA: cytochrome P450 [Pseudomonadales bacterium]|nr:cytochrome P450 [Pseudomonadales bacterium]
MAEAIMSPSELPLPDPSTCALEEINVSDSRIFEQDLWRPYFARLRADAPVHLQAHSDFGPFWSVTRFDDIKAVDMDHHTFSSEPAIIIGDPFPDFRTRSFIGTDGPRHDAERKAVQPTVAPRQLANLEPLIRSRVAAILDDLPVGEEFNWVDRVSIELTTQMLATLFDFPFEDRHLLPYWSDVATSSTATGSGRLDEDVRRAELMKMHDYFVDLWKQREANPGNDFVSMMVQSDAYRDMSPMEFLGQLNLLIIGGNDTTRNSITGGVHALNRYPAEYDKLRRDPSLIPNMVAEMIRWQTPLAHMRRTATKDVEFQGQQIREGDKVVMWYVSGNRDEAQFEAADDLVIDRPNARSHVSFGYGVHRCMGNRLGEMQLRVLWEEIMQRFDRVEATAEPTRVKSNFVKGYTHLPVVLHPH